MRINKNNRIEAFASEVKEETGILLIQKSNKEFFMNKLKFLILLVTGLLFSWEKEGIYEAACNNDIVRLKQFIKSGTDLNREDYDNDLPLVLAVSCGNLEATKLLLENGAKINKQNTYDKTAFMFANKLEMINFLLEKGVDIELRDVRGNNAFILTADLCEIEKAKILLKNGTDINAVNKAGQTALLRVFSSGYIKESVKINYIKMLLENKADINIKSKNGETAYTLSKEKGYDKISKLLLEYDAKKTYPKIDPNSLLEALNNKEYERAKNIINKGTQINFVGIADYTPLMCSIDNIEIMKLLIKKGAKINLKNKFNLTALSVAVLANKEDAVKLLLENNADTHIASTFNNKTPLLFAIQNRNQKIINMIKEKNRSDDEKLKQMKIVILKINKILYDFFYSIFSAFRFILH